MGGCRNISNADGSALSLRGFLRMANEELETGALRLALAKQIGVVPDTCVVLR